MPASYPHKKVITMYDFPDVRGHFGPYGGVFVSETLMYALNELKETYAKYQHDPEFLAEFIMS